MRTLLLVTMTLATSLFAADKWGSKELVSATQAATVALREAEGETAYRTVSAIAIVRNAQGNAANAKVTYGEGVGAMTRSFFCHVHDTEIDCH